jgi:acylphosphatase
MAIRLRIFGRVQGVWYRGWLVEQAMVHAVDGWVRNRADGSVEALLDGDEMQVRTLIERCRKGPRLARVERIEVTETTEAPPAGFAQRPTL